MGFTYRHCGVPDDWIFTEALFQGSARRSGRDPASRWTRWPSTARQNQPIKERTGGSTFKNPPGNSAWKLVDAAGCRGLRVGGAKVSEMHCNFLINDGNATAEDIERLGETVRARVKAASRRHARMGDHPPRRARPTAGRPARRWPRRLPDDVQQRASASSSMSPC